MYYALIQHTKSNLSFAMHWQTKIVTNAHIASHTQYCEFEIAIGYLVMKLSELASAPDVGCNFSSASRDDNG